MEIFAERPMKFPCLLKAVMSSMNFLFFPFVVIRIDSRSSLPMLRGATELQSDQEVESNQPNSSSDSKQYGLTPDKRNNHNSDFDDVFDKAIFL